MTLLAQPYVGKGQREANEEDTPNEESSNVDWEKRYRDLQSFKDQQMNDLKKQLKEATGFKPPKTPEEIQQFRAEYPDTYDLLVSIAHEQSSKTVNSSDVNEKVSQLEEELKRERALNALRIRHPDYHKIGTSKDFAEWLTTKSQRIQDSAASGDDADAVADVLDLYKAEKGTNNKKQKKNPNASELVNDKTSKDSPDEGMDERLWTTKEIQNISITDWENGMDKVIEKARKEGRIVG